MAAGTLPKPGSKVGPCKGTCKHLDCAQTKADAATACRFCAKPIGFEKPFNRARFDGSLAHESCMYEALERNDARLGLF
jgi:hypothetical protein